jgi:hypothetical protein
MVVRSISKTIPKQNWGCCHMEEMFLLREFLKEIRIVLIQYTSSLTEQLRNYKYTIGINGLTFSQKLWVLHCTNFSMSEYKAQMNTGHFLSSCDFLNPEVTMNLYVFLSTVTKVPIQLVSEKERISFTRLRQHLQAEY